MLFDIDGMLADTDALHLQAFNQVFAPHGHVFDRARASKELMGFSNISISERFLPGQSPERPGRHHGGERRSLPRTGVGQIKPLAGLMDLLARADRAGVPMVAVTNAPRLNAEMLLAALGILQRGWSAEQWAGEGRERSPTPPPPSAACATGRAGRAATPASRAC